MDQDISVLQQLTLWGHPLVFWDRLGQVMEFVGALAVVIDLLGADRLSVIASEEVLVTFRRFVNISPSKRPAKIFTSEAEARAWLAQQTGP